MSSLVRYIIAVATSILFVTPQPLSAHASRERDKIVARIEEDGTIEATIQIVDLTTNQYIGGSKRGAIKLHGERFMMDISSFAVWYDGKSMWSCNTNNNYTEVYITTPEKQELLLFNPLLILKDPNTKFSIVGQCSIALQSTALTIGDTQVGVEILYDSNTYRIKELLFTLDEEKRESIRVILHNYTHSSRESITEFQFSKEHYPDAEIIDLR